MFGSVFFLTALAGILVTPRHITATFPIHTAAITPVSTSAQVSLLFVGDMFFDRSIRQVAQRRGGEYLFSCIDNELQSADMVVGNLEGPITGHPSVSVGTPEGSDNNYVFTFPTSTAQLLAAHNVRAVTIGNNHINNFGAEGIESTGQFLRHAGVGYFGGIRSNEPVYRITINNLPVSFVSYNEFGGMSPEKVAGVVSSEYAQGRTVIVYAHWGDEYSTSTVRLRPIAQMFVHAGARLIVGSHPHIVLPHETIDGTPVYYSLGNFIFDQYWDERVRTGLMLDVALSQNSVRVAEKSVHLNKDATTCME